MKGLIFEDKHKVAVRDVPMPECLPGTMIVKVEACGICGSDLHVYEGHWPRPDKVIGHEIAGMVSAVGEGVQGFAVGDRVTAECCTHCGKCTACLTGLHNLCTGREHGVSHGKLTGAFAEYARLPVEITFKMPAGATAEQTVLVEPAAVACRAVSMSGARPGGLAVVIGGGTIGLLCAAVLKARMRLRCMIVVKYDHQAEAARKLGIDYVHKVSAGKTADALKELATERGFPSGGADAAIDTIGSTIALADAADVIRPAGTIVVLALPGGRTIMPIHTIVAKEARVVGSNCYSYSDGIRDFDAAIDLIASGALRAEQIITHRLPLADGQAAFETAADKSRGSIKVIMLPHA